MPTEKETILVSACLLGVRCRYDGTGKVMDDVGALAGRYHLVPVCPEQLGGLPTPRHKAERRDDRVWSEAGEDVTTAFQRGAEEVVRLAIALGVSRAVLKEGSPSCGVLRIKDGHFCGRSVPGRGVTTEHLVAAGIPVGSEETLVSDFEA